MNATNGILHTLREFYFSKTNTDVNNVREIEEKFLLKF